jgi:hypothetical protein
MAYYDQTEYQLRDRLSFMRFVRLAPHEPVPDAKTIWLYREQLVRAVALKRLFARFDRALREHGHLAMGRRRDNYRGAAAAAHRSGEGNDQGRRGAGGVEASATRSDRPRWTTASLHHAVSARKARYFEVSRCLPRCQARLSPSTTAKAKNRGRPFIALFAFISEPLPVKRVIVGPSTQ